MTPYHLSIITPHGKIFEGQIESLVAPGSAGSFGVLANHTVFVSSLNKGILKLVENAQEKTFKLGSGIIEVDGKNHAVILADEALPLTSKPEDNGRIIHKIIPVICILILSIFFLNNYSLNISEAGEKGYPLKETVYSLNPAPFQTRDFFLPEQNTTLSFTEYGKEVSLEHPPPAERVPSQTLRQEVIQKCREAIKRSAKDIVKAQSEDKAVQDYLSVNGGIKLFTEEDYIHLIETPEEQTVQIDPVTKHVFAQFRSPQILINQNNPQCLYLTFIYIPEENRVERILISRAALRLVE